MKSEGTLEQHSRAERDFGLETDTETWVVSVSVSSIETISLKSQSEVKKVVQPVNLVDRNYLPNLVLTEYIC